MRIINIKHEFSNEFDLLNLAKKHKLAFVNIQTTGLNDSVDRIFEVGVALYDNDKLIIDGYSEYIDVDAPISYYMGEVLKVNINTLKSSRKIFEVFKEFIDYIEGYLLCCYNANFVMRFMLAESKKLGLKFSNDFFCIRNFANLKISNTDSFSLDDYGRALNIQPTLNSNRAVSFAEKAYRVFSTASSFDPNKHSLLDHEDRKYYVYKHIDMMRNIFYVGVGHGDRAWSTDRDNLWHRYVDKHLYGKFEVIISDSNLTSSEAMKIKLEVMSQNYMTLIAKQNPYRQSNTIAKERYFELRRLNILAFEEALVLAHSNIEISVDLMKKCIKNIENYAFIESEYGLLGLLIKEEKNEFGIRGELKILDKLTLYLKKLNKLDEAKSIAIKYFESYKYDSSLKLSNTIKKRVGIL